MRLEDNVRSCNLKHMRFKYFVVVVVERQVMVLPVKKMWSFLVRSLHVEKTFDENGGV